jgi:hypothetical protein
MTTETTPAMRLGALLGLAAAALFGASAPVAKLLVPGSGPMTLAGLLYVGAGLGLATIGAVVSIPSSASGRLRSISSRER